MRLGDVKSKRPFYPTFSPGALTCNMRGILHRAVRIPSMVEHVIDASENQGTDRSGIPCAGRGCVGSGTPPWALATASVDVAQGGTSRVAEAAGQRGDGGWLGYKHAAACVLFVKRPAFWSFWSARRPRPTA